MYAQFGVNKRMDATEDRAEIALQMERQRRAL